MLQSLYLGPRCKSMQIWDFYPWCLSEMFAQRYRMSGWGHGHISGTCYLFCHRSPQIFDPFFQHQMHRSWLHLLWCGWIVHGIAEFGDLAHWGTKAKTWYVRIFRNISRFSLCCRVWPRVASTSSEQEWLRNVEDIPGHTWIYLEYPKDVTVTLFIPILPGIRPASRVVCPRAANAALVGAKTVYGPWCRLVPLGAALCH